MKNVTLLIRIIFPILIAVSLNANARMYQWLDSETGSTQLSGKPPVWYRSANGGPRVFVFDNGHLIDDTSVNVSEEIRQRMREEAFVLVEEDRQKAKEKLLKSQELKQKFTKEETEDIAKTRVEEVEDLQPQASIEIPLEEPNPDMKDKSDEDKTADELRNMISEWEKTQAENAKKAINNN